MTTIQYSIGSLVAKALRDTTQTLDEEGLGAIVMRSVSSFVRAGIPDQKIFERTAHIYSASLRESNRLSLVPLNLCAK